MNNQTKLSFRRTVVAIAFILLSTCCWAIDPVRPGDQIEVLYLNKWIPGEVIAYKKGKALIRYTFINPTEGEFALEKLRFPNSEGSWMVWSDQSGKFRINARLIERTETHVKLRKEDDSFVTVPIESLSEPLKNKLAKVAKIEKDFVDSSLVRVGDQVEWKWFSTWYPATVKKLLPGGAVIDYVDGKHTQETEAKYPDLRYPNGEGPWADWLDATGKHKVKGRYFSHDETHVELLREDGKIVRILRAKLAEKIETELAKRPVITRRPKEVEFDLASVRFDNLPSWISFGTKLGQNDAGVLDRIAAPKVAALPIGEFDVTIESGGQVGPTFLVQGDTPMIGLVFTPPTSSPNEPVSLYWIDIVGKQVLPGPKFLYGERVITYSSTQSRLLTAEGFDLRGSATRFCTYRLTPGEKKATAEWRWSVPEVSFMSRGSEMNAALVGEDNALIGYGNTVSMWNLADRRAEYVVPSTNSEFSMSPDNQFFFTNQFSHAVVIDTKSGREVASYSNSGARFCADGKHVISIGGLGGNLIPLDRAKSTVEIYSGFGNRKAQNFNPTIIDSSMVFNGNQLWDSNRKLLMWSYQFNGLNELLSEPIGDQWLAVGSQDLSNSRVIRVGITTVPSQKVLGSINNMSEEQLYVVRPGIEVRIDSSVQDNRILNGLRSSIQNKGWRESPSAELVIKAAAFRGPSETHTYSLSRFGNSRQGGASEQTITASPWKQTLSIEHQGSAVWTTGSGGVPTFLTTHNEGSLEAEVRKCEVENFDLFKSVQFPERILSSKWRNGFGTTQFTKGGMKEVPVR